jgi:hypothetical protein
MSRRLVFAAVGVVMGLFASAAFGQCGCALPQTVYMPVAPSYSAYYPSTVTYYGAEPQVTYYAPSEPQVTYYAPAASSYVTYYAAPAVSGYTTYYGSTVTPYTTYYAPVVYYGNTSVYGIPRVYVPGQPVRNVLRAVGP